MVNAGSHYGQIYACGIGIAGTTKKGDVKLFIGFITVRLSEVIDNPFDESGFSATVSASSTGPLSEALVVSGMNAISINVAKNYGMTF